MKSVFGGFKIECLHPLTTRFCISCTSKLHLLPTNESKSMKLPSYCRRCHSRLTSSGDVSREIKSYESNSPNCYPTCRVDHRLLRLLRYRFWSAACTDS